MDVSVPTVGAVHAVEHGSTSPDSQARQDAVEHGATDSRVTVTVGTVADGIYVADDGSGIPEPKRVFDSGHTTAEDGTGFGLAIVERIASAHGWTVSVGESESGGARFEIRGVAVRSDERWRANRPPER